MATKSLYFKNTAPSGATTSLSLQDGGTAPTGAVTATGWTVAKLAANNMSAMLCGTKRASGTFSTSDAIGSFAASACFRSETTFSGVFANTSWTLAFRVRCATIANQTGAIKVRIWKSSNADGTGATQLTGSVQTGTTTNALAVVASSTSTVTWSSPGAVALNNEYLWVQCEWNTVNVSSSNSGDALIYVESAGLITTPDFVPSTTDAWSLADKSSGVTLSNADKTATTTAAGGNAVRSTQVRTNSGAGKYYIEYAVATIGTPSNFLLGINASTVSVLSGGGWNFYVGGGGDVSFYSGSTGISLGTIVNGDVICIAWDAVNERWWARRNNGLWNNSGTADPATNTGGVDGSAASAGWSYALWFYSNNNGDVVAARTEAADCTLVAPVGFTTWMGEVFPTADAWNVNDKSANITLSNSDKTATPTTGVYGGVRSTKSHASTVAGKFYWEISLPTGVSSGAIGLQRLGQAITSESTNTCYIQQQGSIWVSNAASTGINLGTLATGDIISVAWDTAAAKIWFRRNSDNWNGNASYDPAAGTGGASTSTGAAGDYALWIAASSATASFVVRTEKADLTQTYPASGYSSWMDESLAVDNVGTASGVGASSVVGATIAFDTVTAAGVGGSSVVGTKVTGAVAASSPTSAATAVGVGATTASGGAVAPGTGASSVVGEAVVPNYVSGVATAAGGVVIPASVYTQSSPSAATDDFATYTSVTVIPGSHFVGAAGNYVRLTVRTKSTSTSGTIRFYIGQQSATGDPYDFNKTPSHPLFGGIELTRDGLDGTVYTSDWTPLLDDFDASKNYCLAVNYPGTATYPYISAATGETVYRKAGGGDGATVDKTGYTLFYSDTAATGVTKIEVAAVSLARSQKVVGIAVTADGTSIPQVYRKPMPGGLPESYANTTSVTVISASNFNIAATGRSVRLSVQMQSASPGNTVQFYIGQQAATGDVYDFKNTPSHVTFAGGGDYITDATIFTRVSDWVDLPELFDSSKNYCVAINWCSVFTSANFTASTGDSSYTKSGSGDATTVDKTGYTLGRDGFAVCVNKIEIAPTWVGTAVTANIVSSVATAAGSSDAITYDKATPSLGPNYQGGTTALLIPAGHFTSAARGQIRFTVKIVSGGAGHAFTFAMGQQATTGDPYDFLNAPVYVGFGGSNLVTTGGAQTAVTDWTTLREPFDPTKNYLIAMDWPAATLVSPYQGPDAGTVLYGKSGADSGTIDKSGYSVIDSDQAVAISKIEVRSHFVGLQCYTASSVATATGYPFPVNAVYSRLNFNGTSGSNRQNSTTVTRIQNNNLSAVPGGRLARITVQISAATPGSAVPIYVGQASPSADNYDFLNTPTRVLFSGADYITDNQAGKKYVSDWFTLPEPFDNTKHYLIAAEYPNMFILPWTNPSGGLGDIHYAKAGADAATIDKTGYSALYFNQPYLVSNFEVQGPQGAVGAVVTTGIVTSVGTAAGNSSAAFVGEAVVAATPTFVIVSWAQVVATDAALVGGVVSATATAAGTGTTAITGSSFAAGIGTATGAGATTITGQSVAGRTVTAAGVGASSVVNRSFYATIALSSGIGAGGAASAYIFGVAVTAAGTGTTSIVGGQLGVNIGSASGLGTSNVVGASTATTTATAAGIGASSVTGTGLKPISVTAAGLAASAVTGFSFAASTFSVAGISTAPATGISILHRAVTAAGVGASSVVGGQLGVNVLIGAGLGTATAVGASTAATTFTAAGTGASSVKATDVRPTTATAAGLAACTATGFSTVARTVVAPATSTAATTGTAILYRAVTAAGIGTSSVSGGQLGVNVFIAAGLGTGAATGSSTATATFTIAGIGAATAPGTNLKPASATAAGLAATTVIGRSFAAATVSVAGASTASATGLTIIAGRAIGAGNGVAAATGGQLGVNVAIAAGIGAATFVGSSTAASAGTASGIGAAPWAGTAVKPISFTGTGAGAAAATGRATVAGVATASGLGTAIPIARGSAVNLTAPSPIFTYPAIFFVSPLRLSDRVLEYGLTRLDLEADKIYICNNFPTTYLEATSTYAIGSKSFGPGLVFGAPTAGTPKGRKVTSVAVSGGIATAIGTPQCWAVVDSVNSRLLATGPASGFTTVGVDWSWTLAQIPIHMDG